MATGSLSLTLPPREYERDVLAEFIRDSRAWSRERAALPSRLRRALWGLLTVDLVWGFWLATIVASASSCESRVCKVATLDPYAPVMLTGAALSLLCLAVVAISTRGLAQADGREVTALVAAVATGGLALVGIAALIVVALIVALVLAVFWAAFTFEP